MKIPNVRGALMQRIARWSARRHGEDTLPLTVRRQRIYIIPSRFGLTLALLLVAMLIAGLNYNSNLGLAFGFLLGSLALVAMHHCHRNLLGLSVDATREVDAFAGGRARFEFLLRNDAGVERCDIEIRCAEAATTAPHVPAQGHVAVSVALPTAARGVLKVERFELRTRYPFGWFRAWTYVQSPLAAFVAPEPRGEQAPPAVAGNVGNAAQADVRGDEDFSGLRAYQAGIPLKHMAWKALARGGAPAVRSYTGRAAQPQWLDFATLGHLSAEARLSQLCRWVLEGDAAQQAYGLRLPGTELSVAGGPAQRSACLRALAAFPVSA